jgi:hypothetical protein
MESFLDSKEKGCGRRRTDIMALRIYRDSGGFRRISGRGAVALGGLIGYIKSFSAAKNWLVYI